MDRPRVSRLSLMIPPTDSLISLVTINSLFTPHILPANADSDPVHFSRFGHPVPAKSWKIALVNGWGGRAPRRPSPCPATGLLWCVSTRTRGRNPSAAERPSGCGVADSSAEQLQSLACGRGLRWLPSWPWLPGRCRRGPLWPVCQIAFSHLALQVRIDGLANLVDDRRAFELCHKRKKLGYVVLKTDGHGLHDILLGTRPCPGLGAWSRRQRRQ